MNNNNNNRNMIEPYDISIEEHRALAFSACFRTCGSALHLRDDHPVILRNDIVMVSGDSQIYEVAELIDYNLLLVPLNWDNVARRWRKHATKEIIVRHMSQVTVLPSLPDKADAEINCQKGIASLLHTNRNNTDYVQPTHVGKATPKEPQITKAAAKAAEWFSETRGRKNDES